MQQIIEGHTKATSYSPIDLILAPSLDKGGIVYWIALVIIVIVLVRLIKVLTSKSPKQPVKGTKFIAGLFTLVIGVVIIAISLIIGLEAIANPITVTMGDGIMLVGNRSSQINMILMGNVIGKYLLAIGLFLLTPSILKKAEPKEPVSK